MMQNKLSKFRYNDKLENSSSCKTFRYSKMELNSINKGILIPKFNSKSTLSTSYKSNASLGKILSKKLETKINGFYKGRNFNGINQIKSYKDKSRINLNLINYKNKNEIFKNNFRKFTPLVIKNNDININSISCRGTNNLSKGKINDFSSSLINAFNINDTIFVQKKEINSIHKYEDGFSIKIEKIKPINKELKSIFKNSNNLNTYRSKISNKIRPGNKIILKSNISRKIFLSKYKKVNMKQKNKEFLQFLYSNNNKDKIDKIEKIKKREFKNNEIMAKKLIKERKNNNENKHYEEVTLINKLKIYKTMIFMKINFTSDIKLNAIMQKITVIKCNFYFDRSIINYFSLKYNFQNYLTSYLGLSYVKKKKKIPPFMKEVLLKQELFRINLENEINSKVLLNKDKESANNSNQKFSIIKNKEPKRNTQLKSKRFCARYSLLNNLDFFKNKKINENEILNNVNGRRNSFFKREMYTNINRRNHIQRKQILKKEDFLNLKSLIELGKENQFEFEFHKLINRYDIDSSDKYGNTLLTYACINGEFYITKYLLKNGANPNCINKYRNTPLHYALSNKYYEIADLLLQNKASDNIKNIYGLTPW